VPGGEQSSVEEQIGTCGAHLHSRPTTTQNTTIEDGCLWFFMSAKSDYVADIAAQVVNMIPQAFRILWNLGNDAEPFVG